MGLTDLECLRRAQAGDEAAFHELVDRYANDLFRLAFSLVGNAQDAEDVVQETLLGAFMSRTKFEERSSVKTWLTSILLRQAAGLRRKRGSHRMASLDRLAETSDAAMKNADPGAGPAALDLNLDVLAVLDTLSAEHRQVIVLREMQSMSYDEMAAALGVPRGTIESRLFRARQELKERLRAYLP